MSEEKQVEEFKTHLKGNSSLVKAVGDYKTEKFDLLEVEHGLDVDGNYVYHFTSWHKARPFPQDQTKVTQIIVSYLNKSIPDSIEIDFYPSPDSWDKKVITVIARGVGKKWNYNEKNLIKTLPIIGELISSEINKINPRRKGL